MSASDLRLHTSKSSYFIKGNATHCSGFSVVFLHAHSISVMYSIIYICIYLHSIFNLFLTKDLIVSCLYTHITIMFDQCVLCTIGSCRVIILSIKIHIRKFGVQPGYICSSISSLFLSEFTVQLVCYCSH